MSPEKLLCLTIKEDEPQVLIVSQTGGKKASRVKYGLETRSPKDRCTLVMQLLLPGATPQAPRGEAQDLLLL